MDSRTTLFRSCWVGKISLSQSSTDGMGGHGRSGAQPRAARLRVGVVVGVWAATAVAVRMSLMKSLMLRAIVAVACWC